MQTVIKLYDRRPYGVTERPDGSCFIGTLPDMRKVILCTDLNEAKVSANNVGFRTLGGPGHMMLDDGRIVGGWYTFSYGSEKIWKRLEAAETPNEIAQIIWERSGFGGQHEFFIKAESPYGILVMSLDDKKICPVEVEGFNPYRIIAEVLAEVQEGKYYNSGLGAFSVDGKAFAKSGEGQVTVLNLSSGESLDLDPDEAALCLAGEGSIEL